MNLVFNDLKKKIVISLLIVIIILISVGMYFLNSKSTEGYYLETEKGHHVMVDERGGLIDLYSVTGDYIFRNLDTGDRIKIVTNGIMESYPAQALVYVCFKVEDGDVTNIPENAWLDLDEFGYLD